MNVYAEAKKVKIGERSIPWFWSCSEISLSAAYSDLCIIHTRWLVSHCAIFYQHTWSRGLQLQGRGMEEEVIADSLFRCGIHSRSLVFQATDAYHVFTSGQAKIQQGLLHEGYELISEALNLLNNVYGAMHPEIAACARLLARLSYIMGDYGEVGYVVTFHIFKGLSSFKWYSRRA